MTHGLTRHRIIAAAVVAALCAQGVVIGVAAADPAGPPPTPVPPNGSRSPFPQSLATPADPTQRPRPQAAAALLVDMDRDQVLFAKAPDARRPIASLTKIMTALLVLERRDLADRVTVSRDAVFADADFGVSSTLGLRPGEHRTVGELLYALLLQSANDAAVALASDISGSEQRFVALMDRRAEALGMASTHLVSPNGLDDRGTSTARDLAVLVEAAYRTPGFARIVATKFRTIPAPGKLKDRRIQNRNALLWLYPGAIGVKTGSTAGARYCLIAVAERDGRRLMAIVLGDATEPSSEAAGLLDYGFEAFTERTVAEEGQDLGPVPIRGGTVAGVVGETLVALVPSGDHGRVRQRIVPVPGAVFPPRPGQPIGTLTVRVSGRRVGAVPVIVGAVPPPPPVGGAPWWVRALGAVGGAVGDVVSSTLGPA